MRALVGVVLVLGATVAGCAKKIDEGAEPIRPPSTSTAAPTAWTTVPDAPAGRSLSEAGQCALPVTFDVPTGWTANAVVSIAPTPEGQPGLVCQISDQPNAPSSVDILVITGGDGDADAKLRRAVADTPGVTGAEYRPAKAGMMQAAEASYLVGGERTRAFAASTHLKTIIVRIAGPDHEKRLPVYQMALRTMVATER